VSDGSRTDKCFKDKDVNYVANALKEYYGEDVSPTQVYNRLRKWRQKWARAEKLKDLSGALFDHDVNSILLESEHYLVHCKVETESIHCFPSSLFLS
jgi:methionine salvage enolase-phosphatase E1